MIRRLLTLAVASAAGVLAVTATVTAQPVPRFATPTTSTSSTDAFSVIVAPTSTTTTTTTPVIAAAATTTAPLIATPTTPRSTTTTSPHLAAATSTPTSSPQLAAPTTTSPEDEVILGVIDTSGAVPDGLDLAAVPGAPEAPASGGGDGPVFSAGMTCLNQCIKSGVMYPRGFGALLVVETHVAARVFLSVLDSDNDLVGTTTSADMVSEFSFALDHLDPGETYFVTVAATDDHDDTAHAYGEFQTLSERTVTLHVGSPAIFGGPTNIIATDVDLKVADLGWRRVHPPEELVYYSLPRHLGLGVFVFRQWETSQSTYCEGSDLGDFGPNDDNQYGDTDGGCGTWNTAWLGEVDTDAIPAGRSHWTEVEIARALETGDGVPPDGAGPRYFDFSLWVTLTVEYA
jgi:hypothetical protein